ncbi:MAG TPA: phage terminase large subunit [Bryobacteraceae bacterium]|nr:phage terminase large subunit [Bryobacteraceae bacterium]
MAKSKSDGVDIVVDLNYHELPSQTKFHECQAIFKGFSGGVGSGKSKALCYEALRLSRDNPGSLGLLGAPTFSMLRNATQMALFEIIAEKNIEHQFNKSENMLTLTQFKDSKILFRPVEEFERLRGLNLSWFGVDELTYTPEDAWLRLEGRLREPGATRKCGFGVWTPKGFDWVYYRFVAETRPAGYVTTFAEPRENQYLEAGYYERLKNSYDEKLYKQEVLGEYLPVSAGLAYSSFTREANVVPVTLNPHLPLLWSLDFNVDPMCSVIAQRDGDILKVIDEIYLRNASTIDACIEFLKRYPKHPAGLIVCGDCSANHRQTGGFTDVQMIKREIGARSYYQPELKFPPSNPLVRERVNLTNSKLRSAAGETQLIIDPKCKELIMDFEQVCFKTNSAELEKEKDRKRTHLSDALGYLLWQQFRGEKTIGEQTGRIV